MNKQIHTHTHTHTRAHTTYNYVCVGTRIKILILMLYTFNMCELLKINLHVCIYIYTYFNITFFCDSISHCPACVVIMCSCVQMLSAVTSPVNQVQFTVSCNVFCICYHTLFCIWLSPFLDHYYF